LGNFLWAFVNLLWGGAGLGYALSTAWLYTITGGAALAASATLIAIGAVAILTITVVVITGSAFVKEVQELTAPNLSECFEINKSVQILDGKDRTKIKNKAEAGDILRYTVDISQQIAGIKNVTLKDFIPYKSLGVLGGPPPSWSIDLASINAFAKQVGGTVEQDILVAAGGVEAKKVAWQYADSTLMPPQIVYELKVDADYKGGQIDNDIAIDGQAEKIVLVGQSQAKTQLQELREKYQKESDPVEKDKLEKQIKELNDQLNQNQQKIADARNKCTFLTGTAQKKCLDDTAQLAESLNQTQAVQQSVLASCLAHALSIVNGGSAIAAENGLNLIKALSNCGIRAVTAGNFSTKAPTENKSVEQCLKDAGFDNRLIAELKRSTEQTVSGALQCIGLIRALEAATFGNLTSYTGDAQSYWRQMTGYKQINTLNPSDLAVGDIMIWNNRLGGHIAMVTNINAIDGRIGSVEVVQAEGVAGVDPATNKAIYPGEVRLMSIPVIGGQFAPTITTYYGVLQGWQRRGN
jgi:hypothetical protein